MPNSVSGVIKKVSVVASAVGAGVLAGLMLAPKSGKETRKDIKNKLDETKDNLESKAKDAQKDLKDKSAQVKKELRERAEQAREEVKSKAEGLKR